MTPSQLILVPQVLAYALDGTVQAGFPSPAEDLCAKRIDVFERLVQHPEATYQMRVRGHSMRGEGIFDGDILLIDRAITPRSGHIVIAVIDNEFLVKKLLLTPSGQMKLKAANRDFPDVIPREGQIIEIWGVVLTAFKQFQV